MYDYMIKANLKDASIFKDEEGLYLSLTYENAEFHGTKREVVIPKVRLPIPTNQLPIIESRSSFADGLLHSLHLISGIGEVFHLTMEPADFTVNNTLGEEVKLKNEVFVETLIEKKVTIEEAKKILNKHFGCPVQIVERTCGNCTYCGVRMNEVPCCYCDKKSRWEWKNATD